MVAAPTAIRYGRVEPLVELPGRRGLPDIGELRLMMALIGDALALLTRACGVSAHIHRVSIERSLAVFFGRAPSTGRGRRAGGETDKAQEVALQLQPCVRGEELGQMAMRTGKSHDQPSSRLQYLGRHVDEVAAESLPLPAHDLRGKRELGDPLAEVPGEPGDLEPRAVAVELGDQHSSGGKAGSELLDHVLLVAALVGEVDQ